MFKYMLIYKCKEGDAMKAYSSREVIKLLKADGWILKGVEGSHHNFIHPTKKGKVTVKHPTKNYKTTTLKSIFEQAGLTIE